MVIQNSIQFIESQRLRVVVKLHSQCRTLFYSFPYGPRQNFGMGKIYICYTPTSLAFSTSPHPPETPFMGLQVFKPS